MNLLHTRERTLMNFPGKFCQSATEGLYYVGRQSGTCVADLLQIILGIYGENAYRRDSQMGACVAECVAEVAVQAGFGANVRLFSCVASFFPVYGTTLSRAWDNNL